MDWANQKEHFLICNSKLGNNERDLSTQNKNCDQTPMDIFCWHGGPHLLDQITRTQLLFHSFERAALMFSSILPSSSMGRSTFREISSGLNIIPSSTLGLGIK